MNVSALIIILILTLLFPSPVVALITGVQIPSEKPITRLSTSQYNFDWIKFQYSLGSDQPLGLWLRKSLENSYKVLVSVAKNGVGIDSLDKVDNKYLNNPCPYNQDEPGVIKTEKERIVGYDPIGSPIIEKYQEVDLPPEGNGYIKFRDEMEKLVDRVVIPQNRYGESFKFKDIVEAIELWNEPNLKFEWTEQGLGPIDPKRYAAFLNCGAKGARKGGFTGPNRTIISAALAPLSGDKDDEAFFQEFVAAGGLTQVDAIGWHSNVTENIPPTDPNMEGFQRVKIALQHGQGKPVWITEFGWRRNDSDITRENQAQYISDAFLLAPKLGNVAAMFIWNFGFTKENPDPDFANWDIEGEFIKITKGSRARVCDPKNTASVLHKQYPDSKEVTSLTLSDDEKYASAAAFLLPQESRDRVASYASTQEIVQVDVKSGYLISVPGWSQGVVSFFSNLLGKPICILGLGYCSPVMAPIPDSKINQAILDDKEKYKQLGQKLVKTASTAAILGQSRFPSDLNPQPEENDCNIGQFSSGDQVSLGNEQVDELSKNLGTNVGIYTGDTPLEDCEEEIFNNITVDNLAMSQKLFGEDRRVPDLSCRYKRMCQKMFPEGNCPFLITPPPKPSE